MICLAILAFRLMHYVKSPELLPEDVLGLPSTTPVPTTRIGSGGHASMDDIDLDSESMEVMPSKSYANFCGFLNGSLIFSSHGNATMNFALVHLLVQWLLFNWPALHLVV